VISSSGESSFKSLGFIGKEGLAGGNMADRRQEVKKGVPGSFNEAKGPRSHRLRKIECPALNG
jgi:hypothetical protein